MAAAIQTSPTLRSIELHHLRMIDEFAIALAEAIKSSRTLTSVALHDNYLTDAGASAFAAAQTEIRQRQIKLHSADIHSQDEVRQIQGTTAVRKMLSTEHHSPIQQVIDAGLVPRLVDFLQSHSPRLQVRRGDAIAPHNRPLAAGSALTSPHSERANSFVCAAESLTLCALVSPPPPFCFASPLFSSRSSPRGPSRTS